MSCNHIKIIFLQFLFRKQNNIGTRCNTIKLKITRDSIFLNDTKLLIFSQVFRIKEFGNL